MYKRFFRILILILLKDGKSRGKYLVKNKIFSAGDNFWFHPWNLPSEPELVSFGNNVCVAANVKFVTHDVIGFMLSNYDKSNLYPYETGKIKIGNDVAIGRDVIILPNVEIGDKCIIGAGSVVTKSIPSGIVAGGNPAKVIGDFNSFIYKRRR